LFRTVEYALIYIPFSVVLGLFFASALNRTRFLPGLFQTLYFIPSVTSVAVVAVVWSFMYNPQIGLFNRMLAVLGVPAAALPGWLNDPSLAIPALAIMGTWNSLGFVILLFVSGLNNIPKTYYDAAAMDGAGGLYIFRKITLPLLSPVFFFVLFVLIINSFRVFGAVAIMTKGRPLGSTNVVLYYIYQQAFRFFDAGLASSASLIVFVIMLLVVIFQFKFGEQSVFYQ
jgi:ABC-type sugar transport system permease subunit